MIKNELSYKELENIISSILQLKEPAAIKNIIYKTFHFNEANPEDKQQYRLSSQTVNIETCYKGFEVITNAITDKKNGYSQSTFIEFNRIEKPIDYIVNPMNKVVNDLMKMCIKEMDYCEFVDFNNFALKHDWKYDGQILKWKHPKYALNPKWSTQTKLSPLTIFTQKGKGKYLIEFSFTPDCYKRVNDKTALKNDWLEEFQVHTPSWDFFNNNPQD